MNKIQMKPTILFKKSFLPEVNQKSYESYDLIIGKIIKITKTSLYFDLGLKGIIKTGKRQFLKNIYEIEKLKYMRYTTTTEKFNFNDFLKRIVVGSQHKFIIYQLNSTQAQCFIQFDRTSEYVKNKLFFYEFDYIQRKNKSLFGYVLNNVNGGFSVGINGLVAFAPNNQMIKQQQKSVGTNTKRRYEPTNSYAEFKILNINFKRNNIVLTQS